LAEKQKKPPVACEGPEWLLCRAIDVRVRLTLQNETWESSLRRHRLRENCFAYTYLPRTGLCLSLSRLVNCDDGTFLR
jgi:hypothetical protein